MDPRCFSQNSILRCEFRNIAKDFSKLRINTSSSELGLMLVEHFGMISYCDCHIFQEYA